MLATGVSWGAGAAIEIHRSKIGSDTCDKGVDAVEMRTREPILNEAKASGLKNLRGTIAMARVHTDPNSATSQFFINVVDNSITWTPMAGLEQLPKETRGIKTVLIPDGTKRLFLRLVRAGSE